MPVEGAASASPRVARLAAGQKGSQSGRNTEGKAEDSTDKLDPMRKNHKLILITSGLSDPSAAEKQALFAKLQMCLAQYLENLKKEIWHKLEGLWLSNQN